MGPDPLHRSDVQLGRHDAKAGFVSTVQDDDLTHTILH